jgi:glycosyltransferase involved in cell wall biosynthesis
VWSAVSARQPQTRLPSETGLGCAPRWNPHSTLTTHALYGTLLGNHPSWGGNPVPNILALIPAYNEETHVAQVVRKSKQYLPVLVVDDGSTDHTAARAEEAGAIVLRQTPNHDAVITLDADEQHDPDEIPLFLDAYAERGSDLIIGARRFRYMPIVRRTSNSIGTLLFSWAIGEHMPDNQSGYRLVSRRLMEATTESREMGFHFEVEQIVTCVINGFRLDWVPIRTIYAGETSHVRPLEHVPNFFRLVWQTRQRIRQHRRAHST